MKTMSYRADETAEQKAFKLQAIEFVRLAAIRARARQLFREEMEWGYSRELAA